MLPHQQRHTPVPSAGVRRQASGERLAAFAFADIGAADDDDMMACSVVSAFAGFPS